MQQKLQDEDIQTSLDEAINITEQSLNAVQMKMYGNFGDHSALSTSCLKVRFLSRLFQLPPLSVLPSDCVFEN